MNAPISKSLVLTFMFCICVVFTMGQAPCIEWEKTFGGSGNELVNKNLVETSDGGYLFYGSSTSSDGDITSANGSFDVWVVKTDNIGNIQWERNYGGSGSDGFSAELVATSDGGYLFSTTTNSLDGDVSAILGFTDVWVVKLSPIGDIEWEKTFGGSGGDEGNGIVALDDGGFVMLCTTNSIDGDVTDPFVEKDGWAFKIDINGALLWEHCLGGNDIEALEDGIETPDGGLIVVGTTKSVDGDVSQNHGGADFWVVKLSADGELEWENTYGGTGNETAYTIIYSTEGKYVIIGNTNSSDGDVSQHHGNRDIWIIQIDNNGNLEWEQVYGGSENDFASHILPVDDGYVFAGSSTSADGDLKHNQGGQDGWLVKIDFVGNIVWQQNYGGSDTDSFTEVVRLNDGFLVMGTSSSSDGDVNFNHGNRDSWMVKLYFPETVIPDIQPVCPGEEVSITIDGNVQTAYWFNSESANDTLYIGNPFITAPLSETTHLWVQAQSSERCVHEKLPIEVLVIESPPELNISRDTLICIGDSITLYATTHGGTAPYQYLWNTGDANSEIAAAPELTTTYDVQVIDGCGNQDAESTTVSISNVTAIFTTKIEDVFDVNFTNHSIPYFEIESYWDFGDGRTSTNDNPYHSYSEIEEYTVTLTVTDHHGCVDTTSHVILPPVQVYIPAAFSPNEDGINDLFKVVAEDAEEVELRIFNRWGAQVHHQKGKEVSWNGSNNADGYYVPTGVYTYQVIVKLEDSTDVLEYQGAVTVVR